MCDLGHEHDHGHDKERRRQHHPTLEDVLVVSGARYQVSDSQAAGECRAQSPENYSAQLRPANLCEVGQGDSNHQRRLNPFPQRDNKCLQHDCSCFLFPACRSKDYRLTLQMKMIFNFNLQ